MISIIITRKLWTQAVGFSAYSQIKPPLRLIPVDTHKKLSGLLEFKWGPQAQLHAFPGKSALDLKGEKS